MGRAQPVKETAKPLLPSNPPAKASLGAGNQADNPPLALRDSPVAQPKPNPVPTNPDKEPRGKTSPDREPAAKARMEMLGKQDRPHKAQETKASLVDKMDSLDKARNLDRPTRLDRPAARSTDWGHRKVPGPRTEHLLPLAFLAIIWIRLLPIRWGLI